MSFTHCGCEQDGFSHAGYATPAIKPTFSFSTQDKAFFDVDGNGAVKKIRSKHGDATAQPHSLNAQLAKLINGKLTFKSGGVSAYQLSSAIFAKTVIWVVKINKRAINAIIGSLISGSESYIFEHDSYAVSVDGRNNDEATLFANGIKQTTGANIGSSDLINGNLRCFAGVFTKGAASPFDVLFSFDSNDEPSFQGNFVGEFYALELYDAALTDEQVMAASGRLMGEFGLKNTG